MSLRILTTPIAGAVEWPEERAGGFPPELLDAVLQPPGSEALLAKLRQPDVLVVTSGQQPGLFTGPLYAAYKALSAAALARMLEERWQRPVQAIFWVAGDDHDFAEANHAAWPAPDGSVRQVVLRERPAEAPLTPMYRETLGAAIVPALQILRDDLAATEFGTEILAGLERHYRPEATIAAAAAGALAEILAPQGVLCFDSTHPAAKRGAARHVVRALGLSQDLDRDLARRSQDLAAIGEDPGVVVGQGATLVMLEAAQGRDRLLVDGTSLVTRRSRERFTLDDLQRIAANQPERLSPNVLLRPVIESALLPTVAYMAGPGELRYWALTPPVFSRMRIHRQQPTPRWNGLIVEPRVNRVLEKFGTDLDGLLAPGRLEQQVIRERLPRQAQEALERLRQTLTAEYAALGDAAVGIDPTLEQPVRKVRDRAQRELDQVEHRLLTHLKRRVGTELGQIERARAALRPLDLSQERVYCLPPYLARYGRGLLQELAEACHGWYTQALAAQQLPS